MAEKEPTISVISAASTSATPVLKAVATSESVFFTPSLTRIEVTPANSAENKAVNIHVSTLLYPYK